MNTNNYYYQRVGNQPLDSNIEMVESLELSNNQISESILEKYLDNNGLIDVLLPGKMYFFKPSISLPRLVLLRNRNENRNGPKGYVIRRNSIVIVIKSLDSKRNIICSGFEGWLSLNEDIDYSKNFYEVSSIKKYQDWRGNNYFFLDSKIMLGSDAKMFLATNIILISASVFMLIYVTPSCFSPTIFSAISIILLLLTMVFFWLCAFIEPGIIPRNPPHISAILPEGASTVGEFNWRFCQTCNIYRPPRSKHCSSCQNCVLEFDHHCQFTSNCVGIRNRKFFILFVIFITLYTMFCFLLCILTIVNKAGEQDKGDEPSRYLAAIYENPAALVIGIINGLAIIVLIPFCRYHLLIAAKAETTNERVRGVFRNTANPYDKGLVKNCSGIFASPIPSSLVNDLDKSITVKEFYRMNVPPEKLEFIDEFKASHNFYSDSQTSLGTNNPMQIDSKEEL